MLIKLFTYSEAVVNHSTGKIGGFVASKNRTDYYSMEILIDNEKYIIEDSALSKGETFYVTRRVTRPV